ncbi:MAG: (Fe-S)-binding protein [Desulfobacterales bacterium]|jgi:glycolate oxidase iron-sulfur subunit|nr:(Fe-S)-binding protein [Desulfobacterales bacterium]
MADIRKLRRLMRQLEEQLVVCMRCGMCQAVCPVFAQTGREADVARGKLVLLDGLMQEMLDDPEGVRDRLQRCLLCGSCAANCPSGVNVLEIFLKARAILAGYLGLPPLKRAVFRRLLAHPETLDRVVEFGAVFQKLFARPVNEIVGTSCARFGSPLLADRHFRTLAAVPLHRRRPALNTPAGAAGLRVGFFVGCLIDKLFPNVAEAALRVLEHHGVGVFLPEGQGCCGIPAISSGDTQTFNDLVRRNLEKFDSAGFDLLVTCCATCTSTIKKIWPSLCDDDLAARARSLAARTMDISQFLVKRVKVGGPAAAAANGRVITFHDSCHLKKSLGVYAEPRDLIRANPVYTLKEMAACDDCCGMGGSFNFEHYGLSARIGRLKRDSIAATGCAVVATGCPACMLQISDMLSRAGDRIAVRHPVEIYAESFSAEGRKG